MNIEAGASANPPENAPGTPCLGIRNDPMEGFPRKSQRTYNNSPTTPIRGVSPGPLRPNTTDSPGHHYNQSHSLDQRMYGAPMPHQPSGSWRSPIGPTSPFPQQHGTPAIWNRPSGAPGYAMPPNTPMVGGFIPNSPRVGGFHSPDIGQVVSPRPNPGRGMFNNPPSPNFGYQFNSPSPNFGNQFNNTPSPSYGHVGSPNPNIGGNNRSQFSNSPSFGNQFHNTSSPSFGHGGNTNSEVRGSSRPQFSNSPKPSFGQSNPSPNSQGSSGNQVGNNPSPCSGQGNVKGKGNKGTVSTQGNKKGKGTKGPVSAQERPDLFYKRSMLEDPWKNLKPVVRQSTSESWLPESIGKKKTKPVPSVPKVNLSGVSFAEFLAASYDKAAALSDAFEEAVAPADDDVKKCTS